MATRELRPLWLTSGAGVVAAACTALVAVMPPVAFAQRSAAGHIALETGAAVVGLLAGYLFVGRFRERRSLRELLVAAALLTFGATNLFYLILPATLMGAESGRFATWAPVGGRLLGALLLAAAAFAPHRIVPRTSRIPVALASASVAALVAVGVAAAITASLPVGLEAGVSADRSGIRLLDAHVALVVVQGAAMALFIAAAFGFARCAERREDELLPWLAVASVLAAFARLNYLLFPAPSPEWLHPGDLFRLGFYGVLLAAAAREIGRYWRTVADAAVLEERRRIARDLHDGLAQELAFIVMQSKLLARGIGRPDAVDQVGRAAERALAESRRAIAALTNDDQPLPLLLADVAGEVAERAGLELDLNVASVDAPAATREALARIVREAVTNAAKHASATRVTVELQDGGDLRLRVIDDGAGFDPELARNSRSGGFGLTSMRERARALGGDVKVTSRDGEGTEVEVVLP